jgi:two-component system cell cycle response regulator DivK
MSDTQGRAFPRAEIGPGLDPHGERRAAEPGQPEAAVLIVEDNVANFVLMARLLGEKGIRCEWKSSGYEVVEFADALPRLNLILMDIRLPYEDGFGALRKLRLSPSLREVPVVAVTAYASEDQLARARTEGFNGFIGKPLDPDRFPLQVLRILAGEAVWEVQ